MDHARRAANGLFDVTDVLDPRLVLAGHWSDFFRRKDQSPWQTVKVDLPRVQRGLDRRRRPWRIPSFDSRHFLELERG
jgi:hypothetical protein